MVDQAKNIMIGIFVIAACAIVVFILLFLHPTVGDEGRLLRIRFADIDKINVGTRVTFAGRPVGEVISIHELPEMRTEREDHDGHVYAYELELIVDSAVNLYSTDEVSARTSGLLGEKSVAITPMPKKPGVPLRLVNNEIIYANESGSVEETLKEIRGLSEKFDVTLEYVIKALEKMDKEDLWANIGHTARNLSDITGSLNKPDEWSSTLANVQSLTADAKKTWPAVEKTITDLSATIDTGKEIFVKISSGEGSIGKILQREDVYFNVMALLNKAQTTMNDINHYGILFHLDKNWQRLRARRMNLLTKLCSAQEFSNFFNDEVDQITTALGRVEQVVYETSDIDRNIVLYNDDNFKKAFAELLRRVGNLEESLKMYTEQVSEIEMRSTEIMPYDCCGY